MSKRELELLIKFHRKQMELNLGKVRAAKGRAEFHRLSIEALECK